MINEQEAHLRKSALVMRIVGWSLIPGYRPPAPETIISMEQRPVMH